MPKKLTPKKLTPAHLRELTEEERRKALFPLGPRRYDRLDREAEAEGYERDGGMFRPWYRRHLRELAARTGDAEIVALLDRLDEIAAAKSEETELIAALREWEPVVMLVDRERTAR